LTYTRFVKAVLAGLALVSLALASASCGAKLGGGGNATADSGGGGAGGDSGGGGGGGTVDAPLVAIDAPAPACANGRSLFLNFDPVTLTQGSSDATTDHADWVGDDNSGHTTGASPGYTGSAGDVVTAVQAYLAATPISIVTTRPAAGPYVMVVIGGTNTQLATVYTTAVNDLDCGDTVKSDVAWISQSTPAAKLPGFIIGAVGFGLGLTGTTDTGDCMCGWGTNCTQTATACTLSSSIAAATTCGSGTEDEVAAFTTEFCAN
jgi:hypothetical protein